MSIYTEDDREYLENHYWFIGCIIILIIYALIFLILGISPAVTGNESWFTALFLSLFPSMFIGGSMISKRITNNLINGKKNG